MSEMVRRIAEILDPDAFGLPAYQMFRTHAVAVQQEDQDRLLEMRKVLALRQGPMILQALREPTPAMAKAGDQAIDLETETAYFDGSSAWERMIDEALK